MHSKWGDAALQIVVFDRLTDDNMSLYDEPFCMHIMHQFKQLSALATINLHGETMKKPPAEKRPKSKTPIPLGEVGRLGSTLDHAVHVVKAESKALAHGMAEALHTHEDMVELHAQFNAAELEYFDGVHGLVEAQVRGRLPLPLSSHLVSPALPSFPPGSWPRISPAPATLTPTLTRPATARPRACQISRILRSITTRHQAGGVKAPPPIVSRVFQELSNGVLAYNNACKMKEVPVPFALVHFGAVLLAFFNFTAPVGTPTPPPPHPLTPVPRCTPAQPLRPQVETPRLTLWPSFVRLRSHRVLHGQPRHVHRLGDHRRERLLGAVARRQRARGPLRLRRKRHADDSVPQRVLRIPRQHDPPAMDGQGSVDGQGRRQPGCQRRRPHFVS